MKTENKPRRSYCILARKVIECDIPFKDLRLCDVCVKYEQRRKAK